MDEKPLVKSGESAFPSVALLVSLYALGALFALAVSFSTKLDAGQIITCLLLSWLLASAALGMSIFLEYSEESEF